MLVPGNSYPVDETQKPINNITVYLFEIFFIQDYPCKIFTADSRSCYQIFLKTLILPFLIILKELIQFLSPSLKGFSSSCQGLKILWTSLSHILLKTHSIVKVLFFQAAVIFIKLQLCWQRFSWCSMFLVDMLMLLQKPKQSNTKIYLKVENQIQITSLLQKSINLMI